MRKRSKTGNLDDYAMQHSCKYGLADPRYIEENGIRYLYWYCPLAPCKYGPRYPNAFEGTCPKRPRNVK